MGKIYTRSGDKGLTSLLGGRRLNKGELIFELLGELDELGAQLGCACLDLNTDTQVQIRQIQADLLSIGSQLAGAEIKVKAERISQLEKMIDQAWESAGPLSNFILASGSKAATELFLARAIARRAERQACRLNESQVGQNIIIYLNRLSDALFALARAENKRANKRELVWHEAD